MKTTTNFTLSASVAALLAGCGAAPDPHAGTVYSPEFSAWEKAPAQKVMLYPQKTIRTADKSEHAAMESAGAREAAVKALYRGNEVAILISWADDDRTVMEGTDRFPDGIAMQFAAGKPDGKSLPYIGMGSAGRPVVIHLQKNNVTRHEPNGGGDVYHQQEDNSKNLFEEDLKRYRAEQAARGNGDYQKTFVAEGFRSTTEAENVGKFEMSYRDGMWHAVLVRPIKGEYADLGGGAFPVAFAIWDGKKHNRDGSKWLSGWTAVEAEAGKGADLKTALAWTPRADVAKGKELAVANCAACHFFDDQSMAPEFMAPNLSKLGGQATAHYIKESILNPGAVVVPGYNRNAHPAYPWYNVVNGKRESTMPPFDWMPEADVDAMVAYFKTLK